MIGDVPFSVKVYEKSGRVRSSSGIGRIDAALLQRSGAPPGFVSRSLSAAQGEQLASTSMQLPTFGAKSSELSRAGSTRERFGLPVRRLGRQRVDGHDVEQFMIHEGGTATGRPLGIINRVDGRMRQLVEFTSLSRADLPTRARLIQFDPSGRVESETTLDLS
jgi:hypothetical protein